MAIGSDWKHVGSTMVSAGNCFGDDCADKNGTFQHLIKYYVHGNKSHAFIQGYLFERDLEIIEEEKFWWRSEKVLVGKTNPYSGASTSRNWILNEVKFPFYTD